MCSPHVCAGDLSGRGSSSCPGFWGLWLERGFVISVWRLLIFGIVSGIAFCLEGLQPGSLYCTETAVVGDVGTSCSPRRVNSPARLGQSGSSQGLFPVEMLRLGLGVYGGGCLPFSLGAGGVP